MTVGRKPLPTPLKRLRGTAEPQRLNKREAMPKLRVPPPPCHLSPEEKAEYRRLAKKLRAVGLASEIDGMALAMLAQTWMRYTTASDRLRKTGLLVKAPSSYPIQNPHLAIMNKAQEQLQKLLTEFGMTPSSRSRVRSDKETPDDEFDRFMR